MRNGLAILTITLSSVVLLAQAPTTLPTQGAAVVAAGDPVVYVLGAVAKPGQFKLQDQMSVIQLLRLTEGFASNAGGTIVLIRPTAGAVREEITISLGDLLLKPERDLALRNGDIVYIPKAAP
jgi:protein involved in polysaccharide export with SLBB domain